MKLTALQMDNILSSMNKALECSLEFISKDELTKNEIENFIKEVTLFNPHVIFRPDMIEEVSEKIFNNEKIRSFLFDVQFKFYATNAEQIPALCENLEEALLIDGPVEDFSIIPFSIAASLPLAIYQNSYKKPSLWASISGNSKITLFQFLRSNPIIVTLLLIHLVQRDIYFNT